MNQGVDSLHRGLDVGHRGSGDGYAPRRENLQGSLRVSDPVSHSGVKLGFITERITAVVKNTNRTFLSIT